MQHQKKLSKAIDTHDIIEILNLHSMNITIQVNISVNGKEVFKEEVSHQPEVTKEQFEEAKGRFVGAMKYTTTCCGPEAGSACGVSNDRFFSPVGEITLTTPPEFSNPRLFIGADGRTPEIVLCKQRNIRFKAPVTKAYKSNWVSYHDDIDGACRIPLAWSEARMLEELHGLAARSKVSPKASDLAKQFGVSYASLSQIKSQLKNKFRRAGLTVPVLGSFKEGELHYYLNPLFKV